MADYPTELGENIAKGITPVGLGDFLSKLDPARLKQALQGFLGLNNSPQPQPQSNYNPLANEAMRRAALPPIGGGLMGAELPPAQSNEAREMTPLPLPPQQAGPNIMAPLPLPANPGPNIMTPFGTPIPPSADTAKKSKGPAYKMGAKKK